jgi:hypothetical protein
MEEGEREWRKRWFIGGEEVGQEEQEREEDREEAEEEEE